MRDPSELAYDDLIELVRTLQATLWPNNSPDHEWDSDTLGTIGNIMSDAGLGSDE
jgi:hypothetical protein